LGDLPNAMLKTSALRLMSSGNRKTKIVEMNRDRRSRETPSVSFKQRSA